MYFYKYRSKNNEQMGLQKVTGSDTTSSMESLISGKFELSLSRNYIDTFVILRMNSILLTSIHILLFSSI
jgi:hypothetical protein